VKNRIETSKAPAAVGPYSQAIEYNGMLFVSGQLGIDPETGTLREGVVAQTEQAFHNLMAVLEAGGFDGEDVLRVTVFLVNMDDFAAVNEVYKGFFTEPYPARAAVAVAALPKGGLVEIECIAGL